MDRDELERERARIVERHGPWTAQNIHLGEGVYTVAPGHVHATERNIARAAQLVADVAQSPLPELRILDLGAYECGFAIELAAQGAQVTAVEIREQHVAKGEFARRALGLENLRIVQGDVRQLDELVEGEFDVVLCLGLIYHLNAADALALLHSIAARTRRFALIEGQTSLSRADRVEVGGGEYFGRDYAEDERDPGSGVAVPRAFWFTRPSLVRALQGAGFTTVAEVRLPFVPAIMAFEDHVTMLALKGHRLEPLAVPAAAAEQAAFPERWDAVAHPAQGLRYRLRERWARRKGGGLAGIFPGDRRD